MSEIGKERPTALITGGSKGIGLALAREFARHGHDLVLVGREEAALDRAACELRNKYAVKVTVRAVDLSRNGGPAELFRWVEDAGIQVDVLVNSAGVGDHGAFAESDLDSQTSMPEIKPDASPPELRFKIDRRLFPFESRFVSLRNGAHIHYIDEGEGPVLLFLHGNPTWSFLYRKIIKNLRSSFRCVALDYPGFGLSAAPTDTSFSPDEHSAVVAEFVEYLGLRDITIMVQDWGGPIGFDFAIKHPKRVKGFVIGNTWAWPLEHTGQKIFSTVMGGIIGRSITAGFNGVTRFFMWKGVVAPLEDAVLAMYLAPFEKRDRRAPTHIAPRQLAAARPFLSNIYKNLNTLSDKPTLIVWGLEDFAFQEPERMRFEKAFPNHRTVLLKGAGHFIQEDKPDEISSAIRNWYPNGT